jgi:hypothetical protein
MLNAALKIVDQNPFGSAFFRRLRVPLMRYRTFTTKDIIGFRNLKYNAVGGNESRVWKILALP